MLANLRWLNVFHNGQLAGEIRRVAAIDEDLLLNMFQLMHHYYDQMSLATFRQDLRLKNDVILLFDRQRTLRGFSTLKAVNVLDKNRLVRGIFSGDTVIHRAFWGQRVLGIFFLAYLAIEKIKRPLTPLYWVLISKGYRTYLLMANNFLKHFPRFESPTPAAVQTLMDAFAQKLFPSCYEKDLGVIRPKANSFLRQGVANISKTQMRNPRIRFFVERNPGWQKGDELVCIARMSLLMPLVYLVKSYRKLTRRKPSSEQGDQTSLIPQPAKGESP